MKENFNIIGKNAEGEAKERAEEYIIERRREGIEKLEDEYEKSEKMLLLIEKINEKINEKLEELGIEGRIDIPADQIHIVPEKFSKGVMSSVTEGRHMNFSGAIYVNCDAIERYPECALPKLVQVIIHEMLHDASSTKYHVNKNEEINHSQYTAYRSGFLVNNPFEPDHEHFRGINEAVIEKLTNEILKKNQGEFSQVFNIPEDEWRVLFECYQSEIVILEHIISAIAQFRGETYENIWKKFQTNLFNGEMMFLRDADKIFGKGSLRILASIRSAWKNIADLPKETDNFNEKILKYLEATDEKTKSNLAFQILNERERLRYNKRREKQKQSNF